MRNAWLDTVEGNHWYILTTKLKKVKKELIALNQQLGRVENRVLLAKNALMLFQNSITIPHSEADFLEDKKLIEALENALAHEENIVKQKSRVNWIKKGDGNTRYFYNCCKGRWNTNKIISLED